MPLIPLITDPNPNVINQLNNLIIQLNSLYNAILNVPTNVSAFNNDANYITSSALAPYTLSSALGAYTTASALSSTLNNYVTSTALSSTLNNYITSTALSSTLSSYALTSALANYATTSALAAVSANIPSVLRTTSTITLGLVGTGATGTQISASKDSSVKFNISTSTTSTIGGLSTSAVALKICATNNATESAWTTVATLENDQTITLAVVIQSVQTVKGQLCTDIPAGWYIKLVNSGTGTHSETFVSGQQTVYG